MLLAEPHDAMVILEQAAALGNGVLPPDGRRGPLTKRPTTRASSKKAEAPAAKPAKAKTPRATPSRAKKAVAAPAEPAAAKPIYDLTGPVPAEGKGLPAKVGALLGIGQK